jgi:hypothetical protein
LVFQEKELLAAEVILRDRQSILMVGFTRDELNEFWDELDLEYYDGFGPQELYGTLWFTDGTWANRHECNGSEWWVVRERPVAPGEY